MMAWATLSGAAVVLEPDPALRAATAAWVRPTTFHGTPSETAGLRARVGRGRRGRLPFRRLRTVLAFGEISGEEAGFWRERGVRVREGSGLRAPARKPPPQPAASPRPLPSAAAGTAGAPSSPSPPAPAGPRSLPGCRGTPSAVPRRRWRPAGPDRAPAPRRRRRGWPRPSSSVPGDLRAARRGPRSPARPSLQSPPEAAPPPRRSPRPSSRKEGDESRVRSRSPDPAARSRKRLLFRHWAPAPTPPPGPPDRGSRIPGARRSGRPRGSRRAGRRGPPASAPSSRRAPSRGARPSPTPRRERARAPRGPRRRGGGTRRGGLGGGPRR